jgi:hypothetical protein
MAFDTNTVPIGYGGLSAEREQDGDGHLIFLKKLIQGNFTTGQKMFQVQKEEGPTGMGFGSPQSANADFSPGG